MPPNNHKKLIVSSALITVFFAIGLFFLVESLWGKKQVLGAQISFSPSPTLEPSPTPTPSPSPSPSPTPTPKPKPTPQPSPTPPPSITSSQMDELFRKYSQHYSVSLDLLKKIAYCESKYNQYARNGLYGGLYQFGPATWKSTRGVMNLSGDLNLRYDAEEAIKTAAFKLSTNGPGAWPNCSK